jgi:hypothetical protein
MKCSNEHKIMKARELQREKLVSLQVVDFSLVIAIFHLISRVFRPFLSHKGLVSRRLGRKQGLFISMAGNANGESRQKAAKQIVSRQAGGDFDELSRGACTLFECGVRNSEILASSVEPCGARNGQRLVTSSPTISKGGWWRRLPVEKAGVEGRIRHLLHAKTQ